VQSVPTTADISEKFSRLFLSNWQHRLWTCQEGIFARTLYFQFSDSQQKLAEFVEEAELRKDVFCTFDTILGEDDFMWPVHKLRYVCPAKVEPTKLSGGKEGLIPFRFQKKWEWIIS
jgi:hypothetical protein